MRDFLTVAKALADPNRVRVLLFLRGQELCLCQIIEMLGLAPSTVSKHMAVLQQAGLVRSRKEGRWIYYRRAEREAPAGVAGALRWVDRSLGRSPEARADARRLKAVLAMNKDDLCACYRN